MEKLYSSKVNKQQLQAMVRIDLTNIVLRKKSKNHKSIYDVILTYKELKAGKINLWC